MILNLTRQTKTESRISAAKLPILLDENIAAFPLYMTRETKR